jgi:AcrR family transcriptional regulator
VIDKSVNKKYTVLERRNKKGVFMSPRNEKQNAAIKDARREQILSAALKLFGRRGFAATKISDVVKSAGMSHGLVYHYFSSKEEIFFALLKRAITTSGDSVLMAEKMPGSPKEKIRMIAGYILDAIENFEDTAYYFLIVTHASVMEEAALEYKELLDQSAGGLDAMTRILAAGQQAGEVRKGDPKEMATVFFAALQGLAMYKLAGDDFNMPDKKILLDTLLV